MTAKWCRMSLHDWLALEIDIFIGLMVGVPLGYLVRALMAAALLAALMYPAPVRAECEPYPVTKHSPTGIVGCETYGEGIASHWAGPGVARNDCVWPWTACRAIFVTSVDTGVTIVVTPTMFCDCYTGTANERLVDLDPAALAALGLDPARGLSPVVVRPAEDESSATLLPDTSMEESSE